MRKYYVLTIALLVAAVFAGPFRSSAQNSTSATFTVNSLADTPDALLSDGICADASGACTLRAALQQANFELLDETISFSVTGAINLTAVLPDLSTNMTINGPGANHLDVRRDSGDYYRIFRVSTDATVFISGLTISNGVAPRESSNFSGGGGGIFNSGTLTLTDCVVRDNNTVNPEDGGAQFTGGGGGIHNAGTLAMTRCTVSNNAAGRGGIGRSGGGVPGGNGGGINNIGNLTMTECTVSGNSAGNGGDGFFNGGPGGHGGGIANFTLGSPPGTMALTNCKISDNRAGRGGQAHGLAGGFNVTGGSGGSGGGVASGMPATMVNTTVNNNVTGDGMAGPIAGRGGAGGGIFNFSSLTVTNSTISSNSTGRGGLMGGESSPGDGGDGGGISNSGNLKLSNSTVVLNSTGPAGGGRDGRGGGVDGGAQIRSNLIADNVTNSTTGRDVFGSFVSSGYNLIGIGDGGSGFAITDQVGSSSLPIAPGIGPLALYGGSTRTHALLLDSAAIDKGLGRNIDDHPVTTDQRGFVRPFDDPGIPPAAGGDNSDIGAFERQSTEAPPEPTPEPTPTFSPTPLASPSPTPQQPNVLFGSDSYTVTESCTVVNVELKRSGPTTGTTEVMLAFWDNTATEPGDYIAPSNRITFGPNEVSKIIPILISDDGYAEGVEEMSVVLLLVTGGNMGLPRVTTVRINDNESVDRTTNPIDDALVFVCQHYHDFLNRHPDNDGWVFWSTQINNCGGNDACGAEKRENVSAAFFLSIEFQQTGYFVSRAYLVGLGASPENPRYQAFLWDAQEIGRGIVVGQPGFEQQLEANKENFSIDFVGRPEFRDTIGKLDGEQYVDALFANAGVTPTSEERNAALSAFGSGIRVEKAHALRSVTESGSVYNKLYNQAFVQLQYFGYLRRNADDLPDTDFSGYNFWLNKLNQFTGAGEDVRDASVALARVKRAEMVRAFINSGEYRGRFQGDSNRGQ